MSKIFRFDDVCINADMQLINEMTDFLFEIFPDCKVLWGVSPFVNDMSNEKNEISKQRIFPKIYNAHSDHRIFYKVDKVGIPKLHDRAIMASHGLIHVDHRLLTKETQELSILTSASLVNAKVFIPPFNKWNKDTESICDEHGIELIKFEDGWLCMEYNNYNRDQQRWYLHAREFDFELFKNWFNI
jgi:hypothetical protein